MIFQLPAFPFAEVACPIGSARRVLKYGLNLSEPTDIKHRAMIFMHVVDEILLTVIVWVRLCVTKPYDPVMLTFVLIPLVSAVEEMVAKVAILVRADIRLKIFQDMLPEVT